MLYRKQLLVAKKTFITAIGDDYKEYQAELFPREIYDLAPDCLDNFSDSLTLIATDSDGQSISKLVSKRVLMEALLDDMGTLVLF